MKDQTFSTKLIAQISMALAGAFLAFLFLLHFLKPELDPSWRMISEYEIGRFGWLMQLAFFCWGGSVLALVAALWPTSRTVGGAIARWWFAILGLAMIGAGIFITNPITDDAVSTANTLHTLFGALVIMTFPIAASILAGSLARKPEWSGAKGWLVWGTLLLWISQFAFFGSITISQAINPNAGRVGPEVYLGWPNRIMVLIYSIWLILVARHLVLVSDKKVAL